MRALIISIVLVLASVAHANPKTPTAASLYAQGEAEFRAGKLDDAIESFSRGYALEPKPEFLLNLAQCYRALGRRTEAISHLERFIRAAPDHPLRASAERTLEELRRAVALERVANNPPPPPVVVVQQPSPPPPPPPHREPASSSHTWLWVSIGAVVLLGGGAGVYFATRGSSGPDDTIHLP